jgi:hypothetical protein
MEFTDAALSANDVFHRSGVPRELGNCRSWKRSRLAAPPAVRLDLDAVVASLIGAPQFASV